MADYSQTPLARKLGMRDGNVVHLSGAPEGFLELLEPIPKVTMLRSLSGPVDVAVAFTTTQDQLTTAFDRVGDALTSSGIVDRLAQAFLEDRQRARFLGGA